MEFQLQILFNLQSIRNELLTIIFTIFTISTEIPVVTILISMLYWCIDKKLGQKTLFALCGSLNINAGIKNYIKLDRPIGTNGLTSLRLETAPGYSFPSAHTQASTTFWTSLMIQLKKLWVYILGSILILGAGISRLYLGVHWPIDIIGGWIFGIVFSILFVKIFEYVDETKSYYILIIIMAIFGIGTYFIGGTDFYKLFGVYTGFILGYMIEDSYINFSTESQSKRKNIFSNTREKIGIKEKILRFIIGIVVLLAIYMLFTLIVKYFMVGKQQNIINIFEYIKYTVIIFAGVAGAPAIFKLFKIA